MLLAPHLGHLHSTVLADLLKRWNQLLGRKAYMLTGTDEHGMKVQQVAQKAGKEPKALCDEISVTFKELAKAANISNDRFIRTTDPDHRIAAQKLWTILQDKGYIYKGKHDGWYCVSDETFYPDNQTQEVTDATTGLPKRISVETGKQVEWTSEENYFFRISKLKDRLLEFYEANPNFVTPKERYDEVKAEVATSSSDLSVSRPSSRFSWGIPVPGDSSQTIYVWLDALTNYLTAAGFAISDDIPMWPADVHIVGKDIIRFHAMYWPAFLLAADLPLPKKILAHAHWQMNGSKMSKSEGNVVDPFYLVELLDADAVRYYLLAHAVLEHDCSFSTESALKRRQSDLIGKYGNLFSRVTSKKFSLENAVKTFNLRFSGDRGAYESMQIERSESFLEKEAALIEDLDALPAKIIKRMEKTDTPGALNDIWAVLGAANKYCEEATPWRTSPINVVSTVYVVAEVCRVVSIILQPFLPEYSVRGLNHLGVHVDRRTIEYARFMADDAYGSDANNGKHLIRVIR